MKRIDYFLIGLLIVEIIFILHFKIIIGVGESMLPTLGNPQILLCQYTNDYEVGDIVAYKLDGMRIVHRIVDKIEYNLTDDYQVTVYYMKGDNNPTNDMFQIYEENILCKVIGVE